MIVAPVALLWYVLLLSCAAAAANRLYGANIVSNEKTIDTSRVTATIFLSPPSVFFDYIFQTHEKVVGNIKFNLYYTQGCRKMVFIQMYVD